jgi:hypothetical protein
MFFKGCVFENSGKKQAARQKPGQPEQLSGKSAVAIGKCQKQSGERPAGIEKRSSTQFGEEAEGLF